MGFSMTVPPKDPHLKPWMLFVDGENFTIRGQKVAEDFGLSLRSGSHYEEDVLLWLPGLKPHGLMASMGEGQSQELAVRAYYYTTVQGDELRVDDVRGRLWELGFHPEVFRKPKRRKAKGVDITLTKDMLSHAYYGNYTIAVLLAGDADYVPLVQEVKRLGKIVFVGSFLDSGFSDELRLASDWTFDLTRPFVHEWLTELGGSESDLRRPLPTPK